MASFLLQENGSKLLQENGGGLLLDTIPVVLPTGKLWIGRFVNSQSQYALSNEILSYNHVDQGQDQPNAVAVDGYVDSWTEYDRNGLTSAEVPINSYFDLPDIKDLGDVRQRAVQEVQDALGGNSPGGQVVWYPWYTRLDPIDWFSEDGSKYQTRIEGLTVQFDQSTTPFQRATMDNGLMVYCAPDDATTYLVRDLFERVDADGLGVANIGGSWVTY